jgi:hypothetical protein
MMTQNLSIDQGADFSCVVELYDSNRNPLNTTGFSANACMRRWYDSINNTPFGVSISNGAVTLTMNAATTANLCHSRYVYDVLVTDSANTQFRALEGMVYVNPSVTHPDPTY